MSAKSEYLMDIDIKAFLLSKQLFEIYKIGKYLSQN